MKRADYRQYSETEVQHARDLGFSMDEIGDLLKLWQNRRRASAEVKRIAVAHVVDPDRRMSEMEAMRRTLSRLANCCCGDERPDCLISTKLAERFGSHVGVSNADGPGPT